MPLPSQIIAVDPAVLAAIRGDAASAARNAMANQPRPIAGVDTTNWMGPLNPLNPFAPAGTGWRGWDYPVGINIRYLPRQEGPDPLLGFDELRFFSRNVDIVRIILENRKQQLQRQSWKFTLKDQSKDPDSDPRIAQLTEFFERPDPIGDVDFYGWLNLIMEEMLVIDAASVYIQRDKSSNRPIALRPVDGATIKLLINLEGAAPMPPSPAYQQIIKGVPIVDLDKTQLFYYPRNLRPDGLYGYSSVEQIINTLNLWMRREIYRIQFYTEANTPAGLLELPQNYTNEDTKDFRKWLDSSLRGNTAERWNLLPVPNGSKYTEIKPPVLNDTLDEYIAQIVCYCLGVPPTPFMSMRGGMARANVESQKDQSKEEGLAPLIQYVCNFVEKLIYWGWGWTDIRFGPVFAQETDPQIQSNIHKTYLSMGVLNINEVREDLGREPIEGGDEYRIYEASGPIPVSTADDMADAALQGKQLGLKGLQAAQQQQAGNGQSQNSPAGASSGDNPPPNSASGGKAAARAGTRGSSANQTEKSQRVLIVGREADGAIAKATRLNFAPAELRKKKAFKSVSALTPGISTPGRRKRGSRLY